VALVSKKLRLAYLYGTEEAKTSTRSAAESLSRDRFAVNDPKALEFHKKGMCGSFCNAAAELENLGVVQFFLSHGGECDAITRPLAVTSGNIDLVKWLNQEQNCLDDVYFLPYCAQCKEDNFSMMRYLWDEMGVSFDTQRRASTLQQAVDLGSLQ